ncbi:hypothetical protein BJ138DRAFT_1105481 [Hygrophoropsis aurantiaca]|uniref:Uncharacterized protein n=1 Tax=Hygrophoropsis aurantiaca TaxID=72124 RepID=A0ACB7ZZB0_9AGAM|nr:hypothetical protein BJ138DRAFT_1105481 [Hygrophoropsis aurantiaca]
MSGKNKSLTSKLRLRRALKVARRERNDEKSGSSSKSHLHERHTPPISDDDRPSPVPRVKKVKRPEPSAAVAFRRKASRQNLRDVLTDDDDDDVIVTDSDDIHSDESYEDDAETTNCSDAASTGRSSTHSARDDSESIADGRFDDVFEGFDAVADVVKDVSPKQTEADVSPSTPTVRKSTRSRKATAKVAALSKKSTPTEWEPSDTEIKKEVFREDAVITSAAPPDEDASVADRDVLLKNTYKNLVPLRAVVFTSSARTIGTVLLSNWMNQYGIKINKAFVTALASFKMHENFVNMSRIDPAVLTHKQIGKSSYVSFTHGLETRLAMCVSIVVVSECLIGQPGRYIGGGPRKEITGYFLSQEFERFAGAAGAVFHEDQFNIFAADNAFKFGTYYSPKQDTSDASEFSARAPVRAESSMFTTNASPSSVASPSMRSVLPWNAVIPLYDFRSEKVFDPAIHFNPALYGKLLPSHKDFPATSLALVAYTTGKFINRNGETGLGGNLMWAALLAAPEKSGLPDPPSPVKRTAASKAPRTPTKASPSKRGGVAKKN